MAMSSRRLDAWCGALALAFGAVACDALFGDATQCSSDADCARIGGSFAADGFCAVPESSGAAPDGGTATRVDAGGTTVPPIATNNTSPSEPTDSAPVTTTDAAASITIGVANILAVDDSGNSTRLCAQKAIVPQTAMITSLSFYVATAVGKLRLGVYDATGPNGGPGAKKAETAEFAAAVGFASAVVTTPVVLPAGTYWLAFASESNDLIYRRSDDLPGTRARSPRNTFRAAMSFRSRAAAGWG